MKILNFGSLNIDHVFNVEQIAAPGQTIDSYHTKSYPGGKGLNQTLALARAGAEVWHAGMIGEDGLWLRTLLEKDGVDCSYLKTVPVNTGTAFIQVDACGQNCIVLDGGANRANTIAFCDEALSFFGKKDILLLQNEINHIDYIIDKAYEKQMYLVLNPSPMNEHILKCALNKVSLFIMNEDEGQQITGKKSAEDILKAMRELYPEAEEVLTLGSRGAVYQKGDYRITQKAYPVEAVDTTAAGDTFTGYFLAALAAGREISDCLKLASKAASLAVTKSGASDSIPYQKDVRL
jgi:ribokinase